MQGRPILSAIVGSRDASVSKLERMNSLIKQARETGVAPRAMTCIRVALVFHRKVTEHDGALLIASDSVEQTAIDTLAAQFVEDVAYVVENISPQAGSSILEYASEFYFKRVLADGVPSIALYLGKDCTVQVTTCRAS